MIKLDKSFFVKVIYRIFYYTNIEMSQVTIDRSEIDKYLNKIDKAKNNKLAKDLECWVLERIERYSFMGDKQPHIVVGYTNPTKYWLTLREDI